VAITNHVPDQEALARVLADDNCFSFQEIAPGGFTPRFGGVVTDMSAVAGVRRAATNGLTWDASASYGSHESDFFFQNTVNASLGPETPRDFDPGLYRQEDVNLNLDVSYAASERLHVAAGAEWRNERFTVGAGGRPSWEVGPYAAQGFVPASNGFPGFADYTAGTWDRSNVALYGDVELRGLDEPWSVGGAVRVERFDVFGTTTNGKLSARVALSDTVSLRGGHAGDAPETALQETRDAGNSMPRTSPAGGSRSRAADEPERSRAQRVSPARRVGQPRSPVPVPINVSPCKAKRSRSVASTAPFCPIGRCAPGSARMCEGHEAEFTDSRM